MQVSEGLEVLDAINEAICDNNGRPLQNIRIRHTIILDDPFPDPAPLLDHIPESSPEPVFAAVRTPPLCPPHRLTLQPQPLMLQSSKLTGYRVSCSLSQNGAHTNR